MVYTLVDILICDLKINRNIVSLLYIQSDMAYEINYVIFLLISNFFGSYIIKFNAEPFED